MREVDHALAQAVHDFPLLPGKARRGSRGLRRWAPWVRRPIRVAVRRRQDPGGADFRTEVHRSRSRYAAAVGCSRTAASGHGSQDQRRSRRRTVSAVADTSSATAGRRCWNPAASRAPAAGHRCRTSPVDAPMLACRAAGVLPRTVRTGVWTVAQMKYGTVPHALPPGRACGHLPRAAARWGRRPCPAPGGMSGCRCGAALTDVFGW